MTTSEVADAYIALRVDHDVAEAAAMTMSEYSLSPQGLVDALGAEILNGTRPDHQRMSEYRTEVLSHFS